MLDDMNVYSQSELISLGLQGKKWEHNLLRLNFGGNFEFKMLTESLTELIMHKQVTAGQMHDLLYISNTH